MAGSKACIASSSGVGLTTLHLVEGKKPGKERKHSGFWTLSIISNRSRNRVMNQENPLTADEVVSCYSNKASVPRGAKEAGGCVNLFIFTQTNKQAKRSMFLCVNEWCDNCLGVAPSIVRKRRSKLGA